MFDADKIQMCRCLTGFRGASCEIGEHAQSVWHNPLTSGTDLDRIIYMCSFIFISVISDPFFKLET